MKVNNLTEDFRDGIRLICLVESITGHSFPTYNTFPSTTSWSTPAIVSLYNVQLVLDFLKQEKKISTHNITAENVVKGNESIVHLLLELAIHCRIHRYWPDGKPVEWIHKMLPNLSIDSLKGHLSKCFSDGTAICGLVNSLSPGAVSLSNIQKKDPLGRASEGITAAAEVLRIPSLLLPHEIVSGELDDESCLLHLSFFKEWECWTTPPKTTTTTIAKPKTSMTTPSLLSKSKTTELGSPMMSLVSIDDDQNMKKRKVEGESQNIDQLVRRVEKEESSREEKNLLLKYLRGTGEKMDTIGEEIPESLPTPLKMTLEMITSTQIKDRVYALTHLSEKMVYYQQPAVTYRSYKSFPSSHPPPESNSITFSISSDTKDMIVEVLKMIDTDPLLFDVMSVQEMVQCADAIEMSTGFNVLTRKRNPIFKLKVDATLFKDPTFIQHNGAAITEALKKDIARHLKVPLEDIKVHSLIHGSVALLFSLRAPPADVMAPPSLPTFAHLCQQHGISATQNISITRTMPDVPRAMQLLRDYVRPVVINFSARVPSGELISRFRQHLPVLASLSTQVRIVVNEERQELEIHGSPSARAEILTYFAVMEDALQYLNPRPVTIMVQSPENSQHSRQYDRLWNAIYQPAKDSVLRSYMNPHHRLQTETLRINPELTKGCPSGVKFIRALKALGYNDPDDPAQQAAIIQNGVFGWHGTRNAAAVVSIAHDNLDPTRRRGQVFGPGEYCAVSADVSQSYYWGDTGTLLLFFIITHASDGSPVRHYQMNTHHIVNNPIKSEGEQEMYMVPILIATFDSKSMIPMICPTTPDQQRYMWQWQEDGPIWVDYGTGQPTSTHAVQQAIEQRYQLYLANRADPQLATLTLSFIRLRDGRTENYLINFSTNTQTNTTTRYVRHIQRSTGPATSSSSDLCTIS